jgi:hypothetical protein
MFKRIFKRLRRQKYLNDHRRISDFRATGMAVRLVLSGALKTSTRGVSIISSCK